MVCAGPRPGTATALSLFFERAEQLEFVNTNGTEAMRRYDLDFQIPCFHGRELELLIGVFEKPDVLCLKLTDGLEFSRGGIISRQQLEFFQIPALRAEDQDLECIEACRLIILESVNGPTAGNTDVDVLPIFLITVDGVGPLSLVATTTWPPFSAESRFRTDDRGWVEGAGLTADAACFSVLPGPGFVEAGAVFIVDGVDCTWFCD